MSGVDYNPDYDTGTGVIPNQLKTPRGTFNVARDIPTNLMGQIYNQVDDFKAEKLLKLRERMNEVKEQIGQEAIRVSHYSPDSIFPTKISLNESNANWLIENSEEMLREPFLEGAEYPLSSIATGYRALVQIEKNKIKGTEEIYKEVQRAAREHQKMVILTRQIRDF
mgnify:FL=1